MADWLRRHSSLAGWLACGALAALFLAPAFVKGALGPGDLLLSMMPWGLYHDRFPGIQGVHNPQLDVLQQYFPWRLFASEWLAKGIVPLWNPHEYCGQPFLGNVLSAVLYPFNALALVLPIGRFFLVSAWCHLTLLGGGMWLLLRDHRLRWFSALTGAVVAMFNPFVVGWLQFAPVAQWTFGWAPLLLWAWRRAYVARRTDQLAWTSVILALSLLGGHLQIAAFVGMGWGLYALGLLASDGQLRLAPRYVVVPGLLAGLLALPQILPALESAAWSGRTATPWAQVRLDAFPLRQLVQLLAPWFFGHNAQDLVPLYWGSYVNGVEASVGAGAAALWLGLAAVVLRPREWPVRLFASIVVFGLLMGLGTPLYWLFWRFAPGFGAMKGLGRAFCLVSFGLAALAGFGVEALAGETDRTTARRLGLTMLVGSGVALLVALMGEAGRAAPNVPSAFTPELTPFVLKQCLLAMLVAAVLGHATFHRCRRWARWLWLVPAAELALLGFRLNTAVDPSVFFFATPETDCLRERRATGRLLGVPAASAKSPFLDWMPMNTPLAYGLSSPSGSESFSLSGYRKLHQEMFGEPLFGGRPRLGSPLFDLVGARWIISRDDLSRAGWTRVGGERANVYENTRALPLCFATRAWRTVDESEALASLKRPDFDPQVVLIDSCTPILPPRSTDNGVIMLNVEHPTPQRWTASGTLTAPAVALLTSTRTPGQRVWLDQREARLLHADAVFSAVALPAGQVRVHWVWIPESFRAGVFAALLACAVLSGSVVAGRRAEEDESGERSAAGPTH